MDIMDKHDKKHDDLIRNTPYADPPSGLHDNIMRKVRAAHAEKAERKYDRRGYIVAALLSLLILGGGMAALSVLGDIEQLWIKMRGAFGLGLTSFAERSDGSLIPGIGLDTISPYIWFSFIVLVLLVGDTLLRRRHNLRRLRDESRHGN